MATNSKLLRETIFFRTAVDEHLVKFLKALNIVHMKITLGLCPCLSLSLFITVIILIHPWQIGKSKVFLRAGQMAELDARRAEVLGNAARTIQRQIHTYIARKEFISLREAAINLQSYLRGNFLDSLKLP